MTTLKVTDTSISHFGELIRANNYFVDKTLFIKDFFLHSSTVLLMPRPKRFGKTLNLSMIEHFFDIRKSDDKELFSNFKISEYEEFCEQYQNKYPVINITLKHIKGENWEKCYSRLKLIISELYSKHRYLLDSDKLDNSDKETFNLILHEHANESKFEYSLKYLSLYLKKHFGKKVIILVDEYDVPIMNAFNHTDPPIKSSSKSQTTYYEKVIDFMQSFLGETFKGNESNLEKALLTGVLRVSKESLFSNWNNVKVYDIRSPYFADSFGFTTDEIQKILANFNLKDKLGGVKRWYNGYKFGDKENIYNPWSIMCYVGNHLEGFQAYWVNSNDYSLIRSRISKPEVKQDIQNLIEGKIIEKEIHDNFIFQDFEDDLDLFWTLLTYTGYLTIVEKAKYGNYKLRIPNNEIKTVFNKVIIRWFKDKFKVKREALIDTVEHLINNRIVEFETNFKQIIGDTLSFHDIKKDRYGNQKDVTNEQVYHVYMLGFLAILSDDYIIKSNRESGEGLYDIMLIPYDKSQHGIVIEIKSIEKQKINESKEKFYQRINNTIDIALNQINRNKYYNELLENKISAEKIIKLPIVFAGKEPYIRKL